MAIDTPLAAPRRSSLGFYIMLAGVTVMMAGASAPSPFYPELRAAIGFSPAMMTAIFAVYTIALLAALLIAGSISDHIGRRPALSASFALLAIALYVFWHAGSANALLLARTLQGIASGVLLSTLSATVVDLEPVDKLGSAAIWNAVLPLVGLGIGALISGILMDYGFAPMDEVFGGFVISYIVLAGAVWLAPETAPRHEGLQAALVPRIGIPAPARGAFWRSVPAMTAGWATGGLYLSLGAPIMAHFGVGDHLLQALVITLLAITGAISSYLARKTTSRFLTLYGTSALAAGTTLAVIALLYDTLPLYLVAVTVVGTGFGTCFLGVLRTLVPLAPPESRSELFAAMFTVSYIAFGLPAFIAGTLIALLGTGTTVILYGILIITLSVAAGLLRKFGEDG